MNVQQQIRLIEYHANGSVKRIEYYEAATVERRYPPMPPWQEQTVYR